MANLEDASLKATSHVGALPASHDAAAREALYAASAAADPARRWSGIDMNELSSREQRVLSMFTKRQHVTRNANRSIDDGETFGDRVADRVARFGGSWLFILLFIAGLAGWIALNTLMAGRSGHVFDAYPFIFLNLILSMVAALQAPIILMSQNRQATRDRISASLDYEVNLKSEIEIMALHEKLDALKIDHLEQMLARQHDELCRLLVADAPR
jgi:uncharacterized membrane protein